MKEVTMVFNVYRFEELNEEAKEVVKQWYLDGQDSSNFNDILKSELDLFFPNSELNANYSLNYCQGDGVNVHGIISLKDVLEFSTLHQLNEFYPKMKEVFTEKQIKTLNFYFKQISDSAIELPQTRGYHACSAVMAYVEASLIESLEYDKIRDINKKLIKNFEKFFIESLMILTKEFEERGYDFFYEISEEDLQEHCESNDYWFYENGEFYE